MAEERIILTIDDGYCQEKCSCFPIACSAECEHLDKPTFSYTRQEAIERIAKGLHFRSTEISNMEKDWGKLDESWRDGFCKYAEAALNALLEEK